MNPLQCLLQSVRGDGGGGGGGDDDADEIPSIVMHHIS